ncbi:hypothetical protein G3I32_13115 [Streptomyces coelicoflavus]|uniref:Uncharacterized protein n=1 Tax=Streptomyces coelicoflavus TaxID=285562 RepID=A0A7K3PIQ9_9ACTN|nr:hypothetical protein [Streptomyces coelicoflavus]
MPLPPRETRPSAEDLHRWAAHDARPFTESLTLADAGHGVPAWSDKLHEARTAAEFQAVTSAVLGDGHSALGELHLFLEAAADWCERHQEPRIADRYRRHAQELSELGDQLAYVGEDHLAGIYRRTNRPAAVRAASAPAVVPAASASPVRRSSR